MAALLFGGEMIRISNVSKSFGATRVLHDVSLIANDGDVIGIVGANGCGKSTLLAIIAGELAPDAGSVTASARSMIAYLRQGYAHVSDRQAASVFPHAFMRASAERRLAALAVDLAREEDEDRRLALDREYAAATDALASSTAADTAGAWSALGLRPVAADELVGKLSGGEQTKLGLIDVVATRPDALLLDEPTNSLDLPALAWLDEYLHAFPGPVLLVSHDRALLDEHATQIAEIDGATHMLASFPGNYTAYASEKARRRDALWDRYRRQRDRERRLEREVRGIKATAQRHERISQNDFYRRKAKKIARRAVVLERRLRREVDAEEHVDKPVRRPYGVKAGFTAPGRSGDRMLVVRDLRVTAGERELLRVDELEIGWGERVVLGGPNGSGKTSLMRALVEAERAHGPSVGFSPSTRMGYLPQSDEPDAALDDGRTPADVIRLAAGVSESDARRHLHRFLFEADEAMTPINRLSYGERRRLALAELVLSGANLLLLDEPTNHLDIPSREAFESALAAYDGAILAVTHDRYFIDRFAERLIWIEDGRLRQSPTTR